MRRQGLENGVSQLQTPSARQKAKLSMKNNGLMRGSTGRRWYIHLEAGDVSQRKSYVVDTQPTGWILVCDWREARKNKAGAYGRSWYNDGKENFFLPRDHQRGYLVKGRLKKKR